MNSWLPSPDTPRVAAWPASNVTNELGLKMKPAGAVIVVVSRDVAPATSVEIGTLSGSGATNTGIVTLLSPTATVKCEEARPVAVTTYWNVGAVGGTLNVESLR